MTTGIPPRFRTPAQRQLTAAAVVTAVCLVAGTLWACYVLGHLGDPNVVHPRNQLATLVYALPTAAAGMVLHAHRPGSPLGWVMLVYALTAVLPLAAAAPVWVEVSDPGIVGAVAAFGTLCGVVNVTLFYVLPLWLPGGRLTSRLWWVYVGAVALFVIPEMAWQLDLHTLYGRPNPLAGNPPAVFFRRIATALYGHDMVISEFLIGFVALVLLVRLLRPAGRASGTAGAASGPAGAASGPDGAAAGPVGDAAGPDRDAADTRRHRLRVGAMLAAYLLWAGMQDMYERTWTSHFWLSYALFSAAGLVWAVAVGYLVVRDRGWRLHRAARSALIGLLLATGVTVLFVGASATASGWLLPGRGGAALLLIALMYLFGAALPRVARRTVAVVDRLYYGERAQPYQVLRALAGRVRQVVDPERLPEALCATVAEELRLPGVTLTVSTRAGRRTLATAGRLDGRSQGFELVHNGLPIGELTVGLRAGEDRLDASDMDILRSLADQASPAVASLRLQEDLQASREQIVAAREEERRWLRRDIHDGLGPALAGLRLRMDNAASAASSAAAGSGAAPGTAPGAAPGAVGGCADGGLARTLSGISDDLGMAIREVRRITDRLGPAPLGEFGLARAVQQLAGTFSGAGLTVTAELSPDPLPELPAAVEVAAYRITAEALNNVLRHARARTAKVTLRVTEDTMVLTVLDDGIGYREDTGNGGSSGNGGGGVEGDGAAADGRGVGLRSMADRAAEIGGRCTVGPLPEGGGTQVLAMLPRAAGGGGGGEATERRQGTGDG
ncbi:ATP-binding protein [Streptomyces rubellomurinus]|uniref:ATP-binding protein n=1 Tax=Streptomyces rubellomurinus (strain ATCC 31215) TaxID=359131 RepID=UPI000B2716FE|nr:ATP-binding protein [Streptomyces rubellomurinus]